MRNARTARGGRQKTRAEPLRLTPRPGLLAPLLSLLGLAVATGVTLLFLVGSPGVGGGASGDARRAVRTPNPAAVFTPRPEERADVQGRLLFVKAGNIWLASGTSFRPISSTRRDSSPAWAPDGQSIYFVETHSGQGRAPYEGTDDFYTLLRPVVMRMRPDGSGRGVVKDSLISLGGRADRRFFIWLLQPVPSPDGRTLALVSDAPRPFERDVTLSLLSANGGEVRNLNLPQETPLGHSDPAWSPDGTRIAFTFHSRQGPLGRPRVALYTLATRAMRQLSPHGYAQPSWSPDGRFLAAVRTDGRGRDLVVLDSRTGAEVARLTSGGTSFAPTWSPDGRQIAYLRSQRQGADLRLLTLAAEGGFAVVSDKGVTSDSQLDPTSRPAWHIP